MAALTLILTLCYSLCDPSAYLNCSLSHGQLLSNDALLLRCFRRSPLFIQFLSLSRAIWQQAPAAFKQSFALKAAT